MASFGRGKAYTLNFKKKNCVFFNFSRMLRRNKAAKKERRILWPMKETADGETADGIRKLFHN